ncbi:putative lipoprotein [Prevotella denticola CRIS 18C-A]|uniref:Putative lipoprotein n=1 Tax=Prevotella denticola CRIS 18C-A TaxID=944557 RepID=F0H636_9BACT|nr:hypothetical protein [Prevotella denticola]EGC86721.1 putative lipoprotein [Prevotella denticola CRIS 18C-A]
MKRRKKKAGILPLALAAVLFTACATDDADTDRQNPKPDTAGLTAFVMEDSTDSPATRLVGEHTGSGVRFYWSRRDNLFVDNPTKYTEWSASKYDNIRDLTSEGYQIVDRACIPKAKFLFEGEFTKPEYRVRFLGRNRSDAEYADQVYISDRENYIGPQVLPIDDGQTGDFATGIAHRQADGTYTFKLEHKASYITFRPFSTQKAFTKWGFVYSIEISADQALCGMFDIKGDTIDLSSRPTDEKYKKISCSGPMNYLLKIPSEAFSADDHSYAIMVVAPGTYTNFTVRYRFSPNFNYTTGYVTKTYPRVTFTAGKNKVISPDLQETVYPADTYYMWDAVDPYWKGYEWDSADPVQLRALHLVETDKNPRSNTDTRWYNEVSPYAGADGAAPAVAASRSCKDCPNINELLWYRVYGAPYVDDEVFVMMDHIWSQRMWLKKLSTIARELGKTVAELKEKAPDGVDYTRSTKKPDISSFHTVSGELGHGKPNNMADYFSLPLIGGYGPAGEDFSPSNHKCYHFGAGNPEGCYWSSTPVPGFPDNAYVWEVDFSRSFDKIDIRPENRRYGFSRMWPADR